MKLVKHFLGMFMPYNRVHTPVVIQATETECGIAALTSLMRYHGQQVSLNDLREYCGSSRDGSKASTLMQVARQFSMEANAYKIDINNLYNLKQPLIAFWNFNHYVIINGIGTNRVFINDPAHGAMVVALDQFKKSFTGVIIHLCPTQKPSKKKHVFRPSISLNMLRLTKQSKIACLMLLSVMVLWPFVNTCMTYMFMNSIVANSEYHWLIPLIILYLLTSLIYIMTHSVLKFQILKIGCQSSLSHCINFISHVMKLPMKFYALRQKSEINLIFSRLDLVITQFTSDYANLLLNLTLSLVCVAGLIAINIKLSIMAIIITVSITGVSHILSKIISAKAQSNVFQNGKIYSYTTSILKNLETIKCSSQEAMVLAKWSNLYVSKLNRQYLLDKMNVLLASFNKIMGLYSAFIILCMGSNYAKIPPAKLIAYYMLYGLTLNFLTVFLSSFKDIKTNLASYLSLANVTEYPYEPRFDNAKLPILDNESTHAISFEQVNYAFNKTSGYLLNQISFQIKKNTSIAIVGASGAGKSTLVKLLCGFDKASSGEIKIFDRNIQEIHPDDLVKHIAYLPQEVRLFSGTLRDNLTMYNQKIPLSSIQAAMDTCCLTELIKERGLHASVSEDGANFSGGEKQRIEIARTLLQDTPILILDEPTAALDPATEGKIINNLRQLNKTIIFIAHRLNSIKECDQILVLENLRLVEQGTHTELIQNQSTYYHLYQRI